MSAVQVESLSKVFTTVVKPPGVLGAVRSLVRPERKESKAVDEISFTIERGEIVGFLGPNGAGKTTTIKMLTGILHPTSGSMKVLGHDPIRREQELLRRIALVMGNKQQLWWDLPAWESFVVLKELYGVSDAQFKSLIDELSEELNLKDKLHTQVRRLSLGERMKCELVAALLHRPDVVFLDEPTIGLDIMSQQAIRKFLKRFHKETGCTIILTSHYMQDVEELCERVILISEGKIKLDGPMSDLTESHGHERRVKFTFTEPVSRETLEAMGSLIEFEELSAVFIAERGAAARITTEALRSLPVSDLTIEEPSVEQILGGLLSESSVSRETSPEAEALS